MIASLLAALVVQVVGWSASPPVATVGDTVELTRRVSAEPGVHPRVQHLTSSYLVEPLAHPMVGYAEGAVIIRYTVAFFMPGEHTLEMPGIELTYGNGRVEHVSGDTARVTISSVISSYDSLPAPANWIDPFERPMTRPWFLPVPAALALALVAAWVLARRRVGVRPAWAGGGQRRATYAPVERWIRAGELRAAVSAVTDLLRDRIERDVPEAGRQLSTAECVAIVEASRPDWPVREIADTLRSLDRARFAPALPSDVVVLAEQVEELMAAMSRGTSE